MSERAAVHVWLRLCFLVVGVMGSGKDFPCAAFVRCWVLDSTTSVLCHLAVGSDTWATLGFLFMSAVDCRFCAFCRDREVGLRSVGC
eukprot:2514424-Rhodomonas_salina.1